MKEKIEFQAGPITTKDIELFSSATLSTHSSFPLTFPTSYRKAEFEFLIELNINMRNLLHTEQAYTYYSPLLVGDSPLAVSQLKENKERKGMRFITIETQLICNGEKRVTSESTFVIRESADKEAK